MIALVPQHAEKVSPPRTLSVPYPLGRPLGKPQDADLQHEILTAALSLLTRSDGPIFEDFDVDAEEVGPGEAAWVEPDLSSIAQTEGGIVAQVKAEMALLQPSYERQLERGYTTVGTAGCSLSEAVDFVHEFAAGEKSVPAIESREVAGRLKCGIQPSGITMTMSVSEGGNMVTIKQLEDWYWGQTMAGRLVRAVKQNLLNDQNKILKLTASLLLVPGSQAYRDAEGS